MTETQVSQNSLADVRVSDVASYTNAGDDDRLRSSREATLRGEINRLLARPGSTRRTLQACTDAIVSNLNVVFARIWTLKRGQRVLELQASSGLYTGLRGSHSRIPIGHLKIGLIAETRVPYLTNAVLGDSRIDQEWAGREGIVAFAGYPLLVDGGVVGVIAMFARSPISPETLDTIGSIAGIVAQGIARKTSQKELRRAIKAHHEAVLEERMRIAREMHDGLLQNVTGIALQLRAVLPRVCTAPEEAATVLEHILDLTERTSTQARLAVVDMRHITGCGDVVSALQSTAQRALEESPLDLSISVRGRARALSSPLCDAVTLVAHHAITNVVRHAEAHSVQLAVEFGIRKVTIRIHDDGRGFVPDQSVTGGTHFGLQGMRERAREIGGKLRVRSALGHGTTVSILVPYRNK